MNTELILQACLGLSAKSGAPRSKDSAKCKVQNKA